MSAGGPLRHVSASRIAEIRQKVVDKYGRGVLPSHEPKSPLSREEARSRSPESREEAGSSSSGSTHAGSEEPALSRSAGEGAETTENHAASSSAAAAVPSHVFVEFRQKGYAPFFTVVPTHLTSLEVANLLEAEGCVGAYDHISRGPWVNYTMEDLMLNPSDPTVIFS